MKVNRTEKVFVVVVRRRGFLLLRALSMSTEAPAPDDSNRSRPASALSDDDSPRSRALSGDATVPLKDLTWHFVSNHVSDIYTASDAEIVDAMKLIWKHLRVVMEPSSAVPLATILKNRDAFAGKRVGIIITGGNVDLDRLPWTQGEAS